MKLELRFRPGDDVRALWLAAAAILLGGILFAHARYEPAREASVSRTEWLYRETVADTRLVREASHLHALERQARSDLSRISREPSLAAATANLLATLDRSARTFDTPVVEVQPGITPATPEELQATPLTIRINGRFRNILRFLADLSRHSTLVSVSDTELALANGTQPEALEPRLDATIHATLYRLQPHGDWETIRAPAR